MDKLRRKLIRDFRSSKWLFFAVTVIIFLAVAFYGAMSMAAENLGGSYDYSYQKLRFADFTVKVANDGTDAVPDLASIDGVDAVTGRVNADVALTLPGAEGKKALARVISLPSTEAERAFGVNDVLVEEGGYFPTAEGRHILVEQHFAEHHELHPGDVVFLTTGEESLAFEIAGVVVSPEYIFPAKSRQELLVPAEVFGVVFVSQDVGTGLLAQPITEFCLRVADSADRAKVIIEAKSILAPNQVMDVVTREDQPSNAGLDMDLEQFSTLAQMFPLLFIIVGAMATYIVLTRIVYNQRTQIGLMRAVGYSRRRVMMHYLSFALVIGVIGSLAGTAVGYVLAEGMTQLYAGMINLPFIVTETQWAGLAAGFFLGLLPCIVAGIVPAWRASRIPPAEAMRAPAPAAGRKLLIEKLFPFLGRLSTAWKIPVRNIFRNRRRSLYTAIGVVFGVSLMLVSAGMIDSIQDLMTFMFNDVQKYDAHIEFAEPQSSSVLDEIAAWDETRSAEPLLELPSLLLHGEKSYATQTRGMWTDSELRGLYSSSGKRVYVSDDGVWLSEGLRGALDVRSGDKLAVQAESATVELEVLGFVREPMGSFAYVSMDRAREMVGGADVLNGVILNVVDGDGDRIRAKAYELKGVASVELTAETKDGIDKMMESAVVIVWIMLLFGAVLAMAIVFTTVSVNILERRREIATMRTLGESKSRIGLMITIENLLLGLGGLLPGLLMGYLLALYFFSMFQGDMFAMDFVIFPRTYAIIVGMVILIMLISEIPSLRSANRLDLSRVTKEQAS